MNTFKNYKELEDNIVDWMDRQDIRDKISSLVRLVTVDVSRELRIPTMEKKVLLDVYGDGSFKVPYDMVELIGVNWVTVDGDAITSRKALNRGSVNQYNKSRTGTFNSDLPESFTRIENSYRVYPLPPSDDKFDDNQAYNDEVVGNAEIYYYSLPCTISEGSERNWILDVSPDIYFYGCLMHSYRYVRDMDSATFWEQKYNTAIKELQGSVNIAEWAGGPIVIGVGDV